MGDAVLDNDKHYHIGENEAENLLRCLEAAFAASELPKSPSKDAAEQRLI